MRRVLFSTFARFKRVELGTVKRTEEGKWGAVVWQLALPTPSGAPSSKPEPEQLSKWSRRQSVARIVCRALVIQLLCELTE